MKSTSSSTMNTSSVLNIDLGWSGMSSFPATGHESEISLGWSAMPAFGQTGKGSINAEATADFVRETRPTSANVAMESFWSALGLSA